MRAIHFFFGSLLAVLVLQACQRPVDHSAKIQKLDEALARLDSAETIFQTVDKKSSTDLSKQINADVRRISSGYIQDMPRETASLISQYKSTGSIVKNWTKKHKRVEREIERTRFQLIGLKSALEMKATHDKDGNAITSEYVEKVFNQELTVAEHLIQEIEDMHERQGRAQRTFDKFKPSIDKILEEIPAEAE